MGQLVEKRLDVMGAQDGVYGYQDGWGGWRTLRYGGMITED